VRCFFGAVVAVVAVGAVVAARCAANACGNENRNAFRGRLLKNGVVCRVGGRTIHRFTLAVTDAHDGRRLVARIDQVLHGNQAAECRATICASRHHDRRAGSGGACPFRV
jgi:hypothetical protein